MEEEFSDIIVFKDENDEKKDMYVHIQEITDSIVKFKTKSDNTTIIPMGRVLKIKRREQ